MTTKSPPANAGASRADSGMEDEVFWPSQEVVRQANVPDWDAVAKQAAKDLPGFWEDQARNLEWFRQWTTVLDDTQKPFYKWFTGAQVNIVHNCLDRYQDTPTRNKLALIWEGEKGEQREFSYGTLHTEVSRFANVLKSLGVVRGDRVTIYMSRVPEIIVAMLACAKVGAIHSVVYGGFSVDSLAGRMAHRRSGPPPRQWGRDARRHAAAGRNGSRESDGATGVAVL
jgi:acetyl-CoA synthetase